MSYAHYATYGHEYTNGQWCDACAPVAVACEFCRPQPVGDGFYAAVVPASTLPMDACVEITEMSEALDYPAHCMSCDELLDNDLTAEGLDYVRERIEWSDTRPAWNERWGSDHG